MHTLLDLTAVADWPERQRAKKLVAACRSAGLVESLRRQALCLFGREVENLSVDQIAILERNYLAIASTLSDQVVAERPTH